MDTAPPKKGEAVLIVAQSAISGRMVSARPAVIAKITAAGYVECRGWRYKFKGEWPIARWVPKSHHMPMHRIWIERDTEDARRSYAAILKA